MSEEGKSWIDLAEKRDQLEGTKIIRLIEHLATSQYTLNRNYHELMGLINSYESDWKIWAVENRPELEALQREFLRLLHNFLSSIFSLVEHTYAFRKDLDNSELDSFYNEKLKELRVNECIIFLKDLRIFTQHYKLPFVTAILSFKATNSKKGEGISEQKLILDKDNLLKWTRWSSTSKAFLDAQDKEIDVKKIIEEYQALIKNFYDQFYNKAAKLYEKEIMELFNLEKEMYELQEKIDSRMGQQQE